jgi:hypothetical protein
VVGMAHRHQDRHRRPAWQPLQVDAALVGRRVELVFDPFDLTHIQVRWHGRAMGAAVPHKIGRHVHRKARPDDPAPPAPAPTGIDYLRLVEQQHTTELADRLHYAPLADPARDAELEAELASFAALASQMPHQPDTDTDTSGQEPA